MRKVELAEGVEVSLRLAGPVVRGAAFSADLAIRIGVFFAIMWMLQFVFFFSPEIMLGMGLLVFFAIAWLYHLVFEAGPKGATPGKRMFKLRVVMANGTRAGAGPVFIRTLMRAVDVMPGVSYGIGLVAAMVTPRFQRLGDMAAGTVVVHTEAWEERKGLVAAGGEDEPEEAMMPPLRLTREERKALASFVSRCPMWPEERQQELANIVSGLTGAEGSEGLRRLRQINRWQQEHA